MQTSDFSFNEIFGPLHSPHSLSFQFYPFLFPNLSSVFPSFIVFGSLSVILQGKVIKGQHTEEALLRFVILFLLPSFLSFIFCLWQQTLSGRWLCDKPSAVLCGEIIRQADKALWVSSSLQHLSSRHCLFLFPGCAGKSPVGLRDINPFCQALPLIKCQPSTFDTCMITFICHKLYNFDKNNLLFGCFTRLNNCLLSATDAFWWTVISSCHSYTYF